MSFFIFGPFSKMKTAKENPYWNFTNWFNMPEIFYQDYIYSSRLERCILRAKKPLLGMC